MRKTYDLVTSKEGFADNYGNVLKVAKVKLTAAQIKLLHTTPQTLVPAPGAGKFIQVYHIVGFLDFSTAVFTGGNALEFRETNGAGTKIATDLSAAFLDSAVDIVASVFVTGTQVTRLLNVPIVVAIPIADPGGATAASTLTLTVIYVVMKA